MTLSLELEDRNEIRGVDQRFVFAKFLRTETAVVGPLTKRINPFLNWRIDAKVDETPRGLRVEASAQGVQNTIAPSSAKSRTWFPGSKPTSWYESVLAACGGDIASNDQARGHPACDDHGLTLFCASVEEKPGSC